MFVRRAISMIVSGTKPRVAMNVCGLNYRSRECRYRKIVNRAGNNCVICFCVYSHAKFVFAGQEKKMQEQRAQSAALIDAQRAQQV